MVICPGSKKNPRSPESWIGGYASKDYYQNTIDKAQCSCCDGYYATYPGSRLLYIHAPFKRPNIEDLYKKGYCPASLSANVDDDDQCLFCRSKANPNPMGLCGRHKPKRAIYFNEYLQFLAMEGMYKCTICNDDFAQENDYLCAKCH